MKRLSVTEHLKMQIKTLDVRKLINHIVLCLHLEGRISCILLKL